jgi:dTDP-3-amino-3,4,6-trideoxy-alpha-D-glucose transaminase
MRIPFLDLTAAVEELAGEIDTAATRVLRSGRYILGEEVAAFEQEFASFCGVRHCIGVGNGLDALQLILRALGIGSGDEVIVPAYTASATWMAVSLVGATPVGADVDAVTWNLDADRAAAAITQRTRAIIAVHLFGQPADVQRLAAIADAHGVVLIEDAAQAHGAHARGRPAGSLARAGAFSFYPTKNLGALGDGGAITTDDDDLAETARMLRTYGWRRRDESEVKGLNSRLDELQAALLRVRLPMLESWNDRRRALAREYRERLAGVDGVSAPSAPEWAECVWHVFAVEVPDRDRVRRQLSERGVGTLVHYHPLPHLTRAYTNDGWRAGSLPVAERLSRREISLPLYPQLPREACAQVVEELARVL